jgi:peptide/nickel transport system substrate-binding protein
VDRNALNKVTYDGQGKPTDVQFSKGSPYYQKQLENKHPYNPKKAKALLKQAGVPEGTAVKVMLSNTFAAEGGENGAVLLQQQLKDVGLNADITTSQSFVSDQTRLNPDLIVLASDETTITNFLKTNNVVNWCKYSNADLDAALLATTTAGAGTPEAKAGWKDVQEVLAKDTPLVYLVRAPVLYATTTNVENFTITAAKRQPLIWGVYMTK